MLLYVFVLTTASLCYGLDPRTVIVNSKDRLDAVVGSTFELECNAEYRPAANQVRWEREKKGCNGSSCIAQLSLDKTAEDQQKYGLKFEYSDTYILIIKNVDFNDEGWYYCSIPITIISKTSSSVYLRVIESPSIDPMMTSSDQFVAINDNVELTCDAFGIPPPLIKWTRAGNGMMPGGGFLKLGKKLEIKLIQPKFRGPYICTAINDNGEVYRTINIDMNFAPQVTSGSTTVQQKVGYSTRLICHVEANPKAQVSWFRNNVPVDLNRHKITSYEAAFKKVISKLTIFEVTKDDFSAKYTCSGTNSQGNSVIEFSIVESSYVQPVFGSNSATGNYIDIILTVSVGIIAAFHTF